MDSTESLTGGMNLWITCSCIVIVIVFSLEKCEHARARGKTNLVKAIEVDSLPSIFPRQGKNEALFAVGSRMKSD